MVCLTLCQFCIKFLLNIYFFFIISQVTSFFCLLCVCKIKILLYFYSFYFIVFHIIGMKWGGVFPNLCFAYIFLVQLIVRFLVVINVGCGETSWKKRTVQFDKSSCWYLDTPQIQKRKTAKHLKWLIKFVSQFLWKQSCLNF